MTKEAKKEGVVAAEQGTELPAICEGWSEEDEKWVEGLNPVLQPIARRHSRELFQTVFQAGMISEALGAIQQHSMRNRRVLEAVQAMVPATDAMCKQALKANGRTLKDFMACKLDIERIMALSGNTAVTGKGVSPSGIILDS